MPTAGGVRIRNLSFMSSRVALTSLTRAGFRAQDLSFSKEEIAAQSKSLGLSPSIAAGALARWRSCSFQDVAWKIKLNKRNKKVHPYAVNAKGWDFHFFLKLFATTIKSNSVISAAVRRSWLSDQDPRQSWKRSIEARYSVCHHERAVSSSRAWFLLVISGG